MRWVVVVPVKRLEAAKSRLHPPAGVRRADLALAMALDTVTAALATPQVAAVVAVSDDPRAAAGLRAAGANVVPDEPDSGLNAALRHGADWARERYPGCGVAALSADLPALVPAALARALDRAAAHRLAVVPDAAGDGTTLLLAAPQQPLRPSFGAGSLLRHCAAGAVALDTDGLDALRRDVDTAADLAAARTLGLGAQTRAALVPAR